MTEIEVFENGKKITIPTKWEEMTDRQIRRIFRLDSIAINRRWTVAQLRLAILTELLGVKITPTSFRVNLDRASENLSMLSESCLKELLQDGVRIQYNHIHNPLPMVRAGFFKKRLCAPSDLLSDISFSDFRHSADALNRFLKNGDSAELDECIAILYRPFSRKADKIGRHATPTSTETIARDIRRARNLPSWEKNLILAWFSATLEFLQKADLEINGETVQLGLLFAPEGKTVPSTESFGWSDLLIQIAKDGALGSMDKVDEAPLMHIFSIMWSNYKESKRNEKALKTKKS